MCAAPVHSKVAHEPATERVAMPVGPGIDTAWREQIRDGLSRNEFTLYYQPKVDMHAGAVIGLEALIRWNHPQQGVLQPAAFIPWVEDHELIESIGDWAIGEAVAQSRQWVAIGLRTSIAVNVGLRHLVRADFLERLAMHLATPPLWFGALELELLETSAIGNRALVAHVIQACRTLGVGVALDDFGTGHTCLTDLRQLPVTTLKLDRSFVAGVLNSPPDRAIIGGFLTMARGLGVAVIAEGVETRAHGTALMAMGCIRGQGYGIARPMLASYVPGWIAEYERAPLWHRSSTP